MTTVVCTSCGVTFKGGFRLESDDMNCSCGGTRVLPSKLKPRTPLHQVSKKREGEGRRGSGLRRNRGFGVPKAQRDKVRGLPCFFCGRSAEEGVLAIDPAHLWPRSRGGCGDPLCVIPACRNQVGEGCHKLLDDGEIDALPALLSRGYRAEIAHAFVEHEPPVSDFLERLTGVEWKPISEHGELHLSQRWLDQETVIDKIRAVAKDCGYAVGVHGSRLRDLDLIAVPWTAEASPPEELLKALNERENCMYGPPNPKPHGRIGYVLKGFGGSCKYVDFSIIPPISELHQLGDCSTCAGTGFKQVEGP